MIRILICSAIILLGTASLRAQTRISERLESVTGRLFFQQQGDQIYSIRNWIASDDTVRQENPRLVAIVLDITLGVLGMHRLYLGTELKVPVFYALSLGGGGVLWLVDLGLLIFSKDIEKFKDNPRLFMWAE